MPRAINILNEDKRAAARKALRGHYDKLGSWKAVSDELSARAGKRLSPGYLNWVALGRRPASDAVANALGIEPKKRVRKPRVYAGVNWAVQAKVRCVCCDASDCATGGSKESTARVLTTFGWTFTDSGPVCCLCNKGDN